MSREAQPESAADRAVTEFRRGYSCSQAILTAFAARHGLSTEMARRLGAPFGGGMARMGEVCGALTGSFLVLGLHAGPESPEDQGAKERLYDLVRELADRFRAAHDSIRCRDLVGCELSLPEERERAHAEDRFERICVPLVRHAAELVAELTA